MGLEHAPDFRLPGDGRRFALHMNGGVGENRKRNLAAVANQEDAIFFHAFVSHETPGA